MAVTVRASELTTVYSHRKAFDEVKVGPRRASYLRSMVVGQKAMLREDFPKIELDQVVAQFPFACGKLEIR